MEGNSSKVCNGKKIVVVLMFVVVIVISITLLFGVVGKGEDFEEGSNAGDCINADYAIYVHEADFDRDEATEAFVVIGMAEEETEETVFGQLLFIQDQDEVQRMESAVFIKKDQTYVEQGNPVLFHISYMDGITYKSKIYNMQV